ncbi:tetratricopeptide repeat protein [Labrys monachus]|uniref:Tetratricopeptide (TPR) repeat protein n=1 Tax=Labrys monachus TaxID=217067 RepID=A0ABU0F8L3_9HYPH|nr:tetratricopeptide repeat protein [Labrys monachus]MDQ0390958.1 tetratricopeptide (TPR) repeat protein [Labrys monachus]
MSKKYRRNLAAAVFLLSSSLFALDARASDDRALDAAVHHLQARWEEIKFGVPEGDKQTELMDALGEEADAVAAQYPDRPEALIWDGILTSERASMAGPFSALGLAKRAREILEKADRLDPVALDAGAPTSLGVLYYRVPGFPIAFGDKGKAQRLLEQAVRTAPNGLDAWYFYGDFLYSQGEYVQAATALHHALALPPHPDRPLWDKNRRLVIQELLAKIQERT